MEEKSRKFSNVLLLFSFRISLFSTMTALEVLSQNIFLIISNKWNVRILRELNLPCPRSIWRNPTLMETSFKEIQGVDQQDCL